MSEKSNSRLNFIIQLKTTLHRQFLYLRKTLNTTQSRILLKFELFAKRFRHLFSYVVIYNFCKCSILNTFVIKKNWINF